MPTSRCVLGTAVFFGFHWFTESHWRTQRKHEELIAALDLDQYAVAGTEEAWAEALSGTAKARGVSSVSIKSSGKQSKKESSKQLKKESGKQSKKPGSSKRHKGSHKG